MFQNFSLTNGWVRGEMLLTQAILLPEKKNILKYVACTQEGTFTNIAVTIIFLKF